MTLHWRAWLSEFAGTATLLFAAVSVVRWLYDADSASAWVVAEPELRLLVVAAGVGTVISLLIVSPLGQRSGGHFNPAVTLSFWLMRTLPGKDVGPYIAAQVAGSLAGTALARLAWGPIVRQPDIAYAVIQPRHGFSEASVFLVEAGSIVVLMGAVAFLLARAELSSWTPLLVGTLVGALIAATGDWTGGSFNPARQLGPALLSGRTAFLWCYLAGPLVGAAFLEFLRRLGNARRVSTCQLCST